MELPETTHPHLTAIGRTLSRSLHRHIVDNPAVRAAFDDLAFELQLASVKSPVAAGGLVEHSI